MPTVRYTPTESPAFKQPSSAFRATDLVPDRIFGAPTMSAAIVPMETALGIGKQRDVQQLEDLQLFRLQGSPSLEIGRAGRSRNRGRLLDLQLLDPFGELGE